MNMLDLWLSQPRSCKFQSYELRPKRNRKKNYVWAGNLSAESTNRVPTKYHTFGAFPLITPEG